MNNDEITNKILESGFIAAFFESFYYSKYDEYSSKDRLEFDLCITKKEKIKLIKKRLRECNEIIKNSAYSSLSSDFIRDYTKINNEKDEINIFSNNYYQIVESFEPITNFVAKYYKSDSLETFYRINYPDYLKPNINDVNDIIFQEEMLINFLFETIDNFRETEFWEIDLDEIEFYKDYSLPIKYLIELADLYFNIKRMFIYRNLLEEIDKRTPINFENKSITFSKKLEDFFIQTDYCLVLSPEPMLLGKNGNINLMLPPQQFFKIINDYKIEYPFLIDIKIQELKSLMKTENISINEGISIFNAFKTHYNPIDSVSIFQPVLDLFNRGLRINNPSISEIEIIKEQVELNKYFIAIKNDFHNKLYQSLFSSTQIDLINETKIINSNQNFDFDEGVYKLNLEYFLSVNPKATEKFFIETKIFELEKNTKELFQQINFSCDNLNSIEGHLNNQNRNDYFFKIQYLDYLKEKNKQLNENSTVVSNQVATNKKEIDTIDNVNSITKQIIIESFENIDLKGWEYVFFSENDYNSFTDLLTHFFEKGSYELPKDDIRIRKKTKTKVSKLLGEIYKELGQKELKNDKDYLILIRKLSLLKDVTEYELYKSLTR